MPDSHRPERLKRTFGVAWDGNAPTYDQQFGHGLLSEAERQAWLALLRRLLPPDQPQRVLDVGTGTGLLAFLLAELGHHVTGLDLSEGMLAIARAKAREARLAIEFYCGDAEAPPFESACFDVVISRHVLWTLLEPERAVRAWRWVLRPSGRVIAVDGFWHSYRLFDRVQARTGRLLRAWVAPERECGNQGYSPELRQQLPLMGLRSLHPPVNVFLRAGLRNVRAEELTWLDRIERAQMPVIDRLANHYRRYLIEADV